MLNYSLETEWTTRNILYPLWWGGRTKFDFQENVTKDNVFNAHT